MLHAIPTTSTTPPQSGCALSSAPAATPAPSPAPAAPRPMSAVPVAELPPLRPLPTADPYSPVAAGQTLFCSVFNVTFSTLIAWLAAVPQHLIIQVRQTLSSPSQFQSSEIPLSNNPQSLSERILLACRSLYTLLRVYHTFSSYWERVTPRQLGLLARAAASIKAFSGQSFDFSFWADLARRPARSFTPSSSVAPSPDLLLAPSSSVTLEPPSIPQFEIRNLQSAIRIPFPEWPFTALTAYNASFTTAPGRLLAQVCHDLAILVQSPSPSPSEFESPSQSIPSIPSMMSMASIPPVALSPRHPLAPSPGPQVPESSSLVSWVLYPGPLYSYPHILRPPYLTPPGHPPFHPYLATSSAHPAHPPPP